MYWTGYFTSRASLKRLERQTRSVDFTLNIYMDVCVYVF